MAFCKGDAEVEIGKASRDCSWVSDGKRSEAELELFHFQNLAVAAHNNEVV